MITCTLLVCATFGDLSVTGWGIALGFLGDMILTGIFLIGGLNNWTNSSIF